MVTKLIRESGSIMGRVEIDGKEVTPFLDPNTENIVKRVSNPISKVFNAGAPIKVMAVDCGIKYNIIRQLCNKGAEVTVVPHDYDISGNIAHYDGLFLSNGPGDPQMCVETTEQLGKILALEGDDVKPIFGICLGNQLMGLAAGAKSEKLPFGNR